LWCFFLIDNVGRRPLLLFGSMGAAVTMSIITGLLVTNTNAVAGKVDSKSIGAAAMLYLWAVVYGPSWNGTPWVIVSEVFPLHVRSTTQAIYAAFGNWLFTFVLARATPYMVNAMHDYLFLFFGLCSFCGFFFVWFCVPETKGVPMEKMDEIFGAAGTYYVHDIEGQKQDEVRKEVTGVEAEGEK